MNFLTFFLLNNVFKSTKKLAKKRGKEILFQNYHINDPNAPPIEHHPRFNEVTWLIPIVEEKFETFHTKRHITVA